MSTKLLAAAVSMVALMATAGVAQAYDMSHDNSTIQKGDSASVKNYGYNKQGDHYTPTGRDRAAREISWDDRHVYPGERVAFGTKAGQVVRKGGSAITDTTVNAQADTRAYGTYWK